MREKIKRYTQNDGQRLFAQDRARLMANPAMRKLYNEEAAKKEIWLKLAEARIEAGLTQAELAERLGTTQSQVSRLERQGEDISIGALRRYVSALGKDLTLEVKSPESVKRRHPGRIRVSAP